MTKLLILWLDAADINYASKETMPNLHKLGLVTNITTPARLPCISAKAIYNMYFNEWSKCSFKTLEAKAKKDPIFWEEQDFTTALVLFPYVQHRSTDRVFYTKQSEFFGGVPEWTDRATFVTETHRRDVLNEKFVMDFMNADAKDYDVVIIRDDSLDAYSHLLIGEDLARCYKEKDSFVGELMKMFPNIIAFSDHGANHNYNTAVYAHRLPFTMENIKDYDEINKRIVESYGRL